VPGWAIPFYRLAYWQWVKWPKDFNVMISRSAEEYFVHWIDQELKEETRAAKRRGQTFPSQVLTFDQYEEKP